MGKRKNVKELFDAVEAGEEFTICRRGEPVAMVLPWADWKELNYKLRQLSGHTHNTSPTGLTGGPVYATMGTQADEAELKARYGKSSEELADEAEQGYDTAGMIHRERQAMKKYGITPPPPPEHSP